MRWTHRDGWVFILQMANPRLTDDVFCPRSWELVRHHAQSLSLVSSLPAGWRWALGPLQSSQVLKKRPGLLGRSQEGQAPVWSPGPVQRQCSSCHSHAFAEGPLACPCLHHEAWRGPEGVPGSSCFPGQCSVIIRQAQPCTHGPSGHPLPLDSACASWEGQDQQPGLGVLGGQGRESLRRSPWSGHELGSAGRQTLGTFGTSLSLWAEQG